MAGQWLTTSKGGKRFVAFRAEVRNDVRRLSPFVSGRNLPLAAEEFR